jgi:formamidopyrimidine-DNA glycosylase
VPELPEVETVRRGLAEKFVGRRIERVEVGRDRAVRRTSREELTARLTGRRALDARRRGKYLLFTLDSGDEMMIHLRMSGQVLIASPELERPDHCHVVLTLGARVEQSDRSNPPEELRFIDPRTFGEVIAFDPRRIPPVLPELARLGVDPVADGLSADDVQRIMSGTRRSLKAVLLDQHLIAGIGNIYADEILHRARLHPRRSASTLGRREATRLRDATVEVLGEAVALGGSTLRDARYVDTSGSGGAFQDLHRVYGRAGEMCVTCRRSRVQSERVAGRTTSWCPRCQPSPDQRPGGRVVG